MDGNRALYMMVFLVFSSLTFCIGRFVEQYTWHFGADIQYDDIMHVLSCLTLCDRMYCSPPGSSVHGFSRQEYWSGFPFPSPGDLPNPEIEPASLTSPALQADSLPSESPGKPSIIHNILL